MTLGRPLGSALTEAELEVEATPPESENAATAASAFASQTLTSPSAPPLTKAPESTGYQVTQVAAKRWATAVGKEEEEELLLAAAGALPPMTKSGGTATTGAAGVAASPLPPPPPTSNADTLPSPLAASR
jgi:hypothetical protein